MTSRPGAALALVATLLFAGCSSDDDPAAGAESPDETGSPGSDATVGSDPPAPSEPAAAPVWEVPLPVVGQPVPAGDVAVVYTAAGGELAVVGLDPASGEQVWTKPVTPSTAPPGVVQTPQVVGPEERPLVAYYEPNAEAPLLADLVVVDAAAGGEVHRERGYFFNSPPQSCAEDSPDVCVSAYRPGAESTPYRLTLDSGEFARSEGGPPGSRPIGPLGLLDLGGRDPEYLARFVDGRVRWRVAVDDAFPAGSSSDTGWTFRHHEPAGLIYGSVGPPVERNAAGTGGRVDFAQFGTAGIDAETGEVRWQEPGTSAFCTYDIRVDPDDPDSAELPTRCRQSGVQSGLIDDPRFHDLSVALEGYDVATGSTTWTVDLGAAEEFVTDTDDIYAGATSLLVQAESGDLVVDLATGATSEPAADQVYLCLREATFEYPEPVLSSGKEFTERTGGQLATACDSSGAASQAPLPGGLVEIAGATVGGSRIVATEAGLTAYAVQDAGS